MHNIQDKDLDQLFKDKLADAAVEPPAVLWANIEQQIQPKQKRPLPIYWMPAAMAFVAIAAGLLFNDEDKMQLHGSPEVVTTEIKPSQEVKELPVIEPVITPVQKAKEVLTAKQPAVRRQPENVLIAMQPSAPKVHLKHINTTKKQELKVAEMEIEVAQVTPSPAATEEAIAGQGVAETEGVTNEKNGINNIGDLVNLVVEKVDKREKKFLQFKSDDDDNSSLVAINIGIIKLNGKNKSKR
ncbi:hypothetical protein [Pedobacter immunditicola]|uniref:hypothetical protein n=1 Tax=Pedobacter immunditicola TaxID=3133440 RepID=UPI0030B0EC66